MLFGPECSMARSRRPEMGEYKNQIPSHFQQSHIAWSEIFMILSGNSTGLASAVVHTRVFRMESWCVKRGFEWAIGRVHCFGMLALWVLSWQAMEYKKDARNWWNNSAFCKMQPWSFVLYNLTRLWPLPKSLIPRKSKTDSLNFRKRQSYFRINNALVLIGTLFHS